MGVDNGCELAEPVQLKTIISTEAEEDCGKEETEESTAAANETETIDTVEAAVLEIDERRPEINPRKDWFLNLTPQDRSFATICNDEDFITAVLASSAAVAKPLGGATSSGELCFPGLL